MSADVASVAFYQEDSASPLTASKPTASNGDLLLFILGSDGGSLTDLTTPSGWSVLSADVDNTGGCKARGWYNVVDGTDPSSWNFPYNGSADVTGAMIVITGADTSSTPTIVVTTQAMGPTLGTMTGTAATPTGGDDLLIDVMVCTSGGTVFAYTVPTGTTDRGSVQVSGNLQAMAVASKQLSSSASTGTQAWTGITPANTPGGTFTICVKSAAGGSTTPALADAGSTAEALTVAAAVPVADSGSAAAALTVAAAVPTADSASAAAAFTVAAAVALADAGSAAEALAVAAAVALADAGSSSETGTAGVAIAEPESAAAADSVTVAAAAPLPEGGAAAEALTVSAGVALADAGSAGEALVAGIGIAAAEGGAGGDALTVAAAVPLPEGGAASEALQVVVTLSLADAGSAAEALATAEARAGLAGGAHGPTALAAGKIVVHTGTIAGAIT